MVEVFITDIKKQTQVKNIVKDLELAFSELKINFDIDETDLPFPEGHTVLRVEGKNIDTNSIIVLVEQSKFRCEIMKDTIP